MNREVQSVLVVLVGSALLRISLTDVHLRYVKPEMAPFLVAAGALMVLLGLWTVLVEGFLRPRSGSGQAQDGRTHDEQGSDGQDEEHGAVHEHGHGPRVAWLLLLPVLGIFLVAPPALGSWSAAREPGRTPPPPAGSTLDPLPAGDPVATSLTDFVTRAAFDDAATLLGRRVRLTGFVTPDGEGGWWLSRMAMSCCAADGYPVSVRILDVPAPPADTWVQVDGRHVADPAAAEAGDPPSLQVEDLVPVDEPREPYES